MFEITRNPIESTTESDVHVWRLTASVLSQDSDVTSAIFVYHVMPAGSETEEIFECVASVPQLSQIGLEPVDDGETQIPYYRRDDLVLDFRSAEEAYEVWETIRNDIIALANNLSAAAALSATITEVVP
jgi:hypothetical protein